jgi:uncharacterized protein
MLHWASSMLTWSGRPPDPRLRGDDWRETWLRRLENVTSWIEPWLAHQRRDDYWRAGSVCEDYAAIECPVYAVGGFTDGYTNAVPRLLECLSGPRKGLIGPWAHAFPDDALPGPSIGFLQECVRWWDHWLKGVDNGVMDEPMLRVWMQESVQPRPSYELRPGRWVAESSWPSPKVETQRLTLPGGERSLCSPQSTGSEAGVWTASGQAADLAGDQRADDGRSLVFDFEFLAEPLEILGLPALRLEIALDKPLGLVCVRLCDVFPDGTSALVTRGVLNLAHRESHEKPSALEPGARYEVRVPLDVIAHSFPVGHHLRVALSPAYWPWAWPSPEDVALTVFSGTLELPVRPPRAEDDDLPPFGEPEHSAPLEIEQLEPGGGGRRLIRDLETGRAEQTFDWDLGGTARLVPIDLETSDTSHTVYSIRDDDPLSATVRFRATTGMARGEWRTSAEVASSMTCDREAFHVAMRLDVREGDESVFEREWKLSFPRDHV